MKKNSAPTFEVTDRMNTSEFQKLGTFLTLNHLIPTTSGQSEQVEAILTRKAITPVLDQEVWRQANTEFEKLRNEVAFPPGSEKIVQVQTGQRTKPSQVIITLVIRKKHPKIQTNYRRTMFPPWQVMIIRNLCLQKKTQRKYLPVMDSFTIFQWNIVSLNSLKVNELTKNIKSHYYPSCLPTGNKFT